MKRFSIVLIVLLAILLTAVAVYAAPPDVTVTDFAETDELENCGDFVILIDSVGTETVKSYYNQDGELVKEILHVSGSDTLYREGHLEKSIGGRFTDNLKVFFDPDSGEVNGHYAGNPWNIHIPGVGPVYKISGPAFFEGEFGNFVKEEGKFVYDAEALCAYFAS